MPSVVALIVSILYTTVGLCEPELASNPLVFTSAAVIVFLFLILQKKQST